MTARLRETARRLLSEGTVQVVIGYGEGLRGGPARPVFIERSEDAGLLVWNDRCYSNLAAYLKRKEVRARGSIALVVKACDERALVVLERESQIDRRGLYVIGMACSGVAGAAKCARCTDRVPRFANEVIGEAAGGEVAAGEDRVAAFLKKSAQERWQFWREELDRCLKCYACRQVCPLCYCEKCVADKNRPVRIETSPSPRGNFAWHITRAFHLAGRCIGCGECARACPVGIDLGLLNASLAHVVDEEFSCKPGADPASPPLFGTWSAKDQEDFIR